MVWGPDTYLTNSRSTGPHQRMHFSVTPSTFPRFPSFVALSRLGLNVGLAGVAQNAPACVSHCVPSRPISILLSSHTCKILPVNTELEIKSELKF